MAKRNKRLKKGIESLKKVIEEHFLKIERDLGEDKFERGKYHVDEIDSSFFYALENKINLLKKDPEYSSLLKKYKERLEVYKKKLDFKP